MNVIVDMGTAMSTTSVPLSHGKGKAVPHMDQDQRDGKAFFRGLSLRE